ncbi:MAG: EcsC family protein [Oscillospiraceae bacterium]|nr:EcsC family protein [Oscillospiraceae bacterium]
MKNKNKFSQEDILKVLDTCYEKATNGISKISPSIDQLAGDYLSKHTSKEEAIKDMLKKQVLKCTTSGFITGFGGAITLPVTIPANIGSVLYVQMRMIACTAYMAGYDISSDQVQTLVYACLAGLSVGEIAKQFGIKFGQKVAVGMIEKIPGKFLTKINQKVGFRLLTKFGEKGLINLGKLVPGVGAVINGGVDFAETKAIAKRAYQMFVENNFDIGEKIDDIIDAETTAI